MAKVIKMPMTPSKKPRRFQVILPTPWPMINVDDQFTESTVAPLGDFIRLDTRRVAGMELQFKSDELVEI